MCRVTLVRIRRVIASLAVLLLVVVGPSVHCMTCPGGCATEYGSPEVRCRLSVVVGRCAELLFMVVDQILVQAFLEQL